MPVPGRPRNPLEQSPARFRRRAPRFAEIPGESPGLMDLDTRSDSAGPGTIRRTWRPAAGFVPAPPPYSWIGESSGGRASITRQLRYKAATVFRGAGTSSPRFGPRVIVPRSHLGRPVTIAAGNKQGRPVVRNRMASFGRRVKPMNQPSPAAENV